MIGFTIRERGPTPRHVVRVMRTASKAGYEQAGRWWFQECRPKHFTREAYRLYGYTPRVGEGGAAVQKMWKGTYTARKLKKWGHTDPLVYGGFTRRITNSATITATSKSVRVVMPAGNLAMQPKKARMILLNDAEVVTQHELARMAAIIDRIIDNHLKSANETHETKI